MEIKPTQTNTFQLILQPRPTDMETARKAAGDLYWEFRTDADHTREKLLSAGPTVFMDGEKPALSKISKRLKTHGYLSSVHAAPIKPVKVLRVKQIRKDGDTIIFTTSDGPVKITSDMTVVGIMGDVSGRVGRCPGQNQQQRYQEILKALPALDLLLLPGNTDSPVCLRFFWPPATAEDPKTEAARSEKLRKILVSCYLSCKRFFFHTDFGNADLPGTVPQKAETNGEIKGNLTCLAALDAYLSAVYRQIVLNGNRVKAATFFNIMAAAPVMGTVAGNGGNRDAGTGAPDKNEKSPAELKPKFSPVDPYRDLPPSPVWPEEIDLLNLQRNLMILLSLLPVIFLSVFLIYVFLYSDFGRSVTAAVFDSGLDKWLVFAAASAGFFVLSFHYYRILRFIGDTPTSKARSAAMGMVELTGRAIRKYEITSPMTQTPCVYYHIEKFRRGRKNEWQKYKTMNSGRVPFYLEDETGRVLIHPKGARFDQLRRQEFEENLLLVPHGIGIPIPPGEKWVENVVYETAPLYVLGYAVPMQRASVSLRERWLEKLRLLKTNPEAMAKYDTNNDGRIDPEEWEAARSDMETEAIRESLTEKETPQALQRMDIVKPPFWGIPLLIAQTRMEVKLIRQYRWLGIGSFIVCIVFAIASVWSAFS